MMKRHLVINSTCIEGQLRLAVATLVLLFCTVSAVAQQPVFQQEFTYSDISNGTLGSTSLVIPPINQAAQDIAVRSRKLYLRLDLGQPYPLGGLEWQYQLQLELKAYDAGNSLLVTYPLTFNLHDNSAGATAEPEGLGFVDYTTIASQLHHFDVTVNANGLSGAAAYLAEQHIHLSIYGQDDLGYAIVNGSSTAVVVDPASMRVEGIGSSPIDGRFTNVRFSWNILNPTNRYIEHYDLDVLHVQPDLNGNVVADEWERATRVEVDFGATEYTMTVPEGTGYYVWRVRPVGTWYDGGRANRRNYGKWTIPSSAVSSLQTNFDFSSGLAADEIGRPNSPANVLNTGNPIVWGDYFYYEQFDNDVNFIYSRSWSEGARQAEQMTFANGLNQAVQSQTKVFSKNQVMGVQKVYDFSARPALESMVAPVGSDQLGYQPNFFNSASGVPFQASDFDADATLYTPNSFDGAANSPEGYYSESTLGGMKDFYVPAANGTPYKRTLFQPDATQRVWKQAGVGNTMKLSNSDDPNVSHNITVQYSGVAQIELDRVFGSEAPLANTVYKMQSTDPNGVKQVSYVSKKGETIATALNGAVSLDNLSNLDDPQDFTFSVSQTLSGGTVDAANYVSTESTSIMVDGDTDHDANPSTPLVARVDLDYSITPKTFAPECETSCTQCDLCWDCDYTIEISILCPQDPNDPKRNGSIVFELQPSDLLNCPNPSGAAKSFDDLIALGYTLNIPAPGNTNNDYTSFLPNKYVELPTGTYHITKKVYANNVAAPATQATFLDQAIADLQLQAESWTQNDNCCGPFSPDLSGFDCSNPPEIVCTSPTDPTYLTEIAGLAAHVHNYVLMEQGDLSTGANYADAYINGGLAGLTGTSYLNVADLETLFADLICEGAITSSEIYYCAEVFGGHLIQNMEKAELAITGGANAATGNNPPVQVNPYYDFLGSFFDCIGYDPFKRSCSKYKNLVRFTGTSSGSQEEQDAIAAASAAAAAGDNYYMYVVWDQGTTGGATVDANYLANFAPYSSFLSTYPTATFFFAYIEIPDPGNLANSSALALMYDQCYTANQYPNTTTNGLTEQDARDQLATSFCKCLKVAYAGVTDPDPAPAGALDFDVVSTCEEQCFASRSAFEVAINNYILAENSSDQDVNIHPDGFLSDETNPLTGYSIWADPMASGFNSNTDRWRDFSDLFPGEDQECYIDAMVEQCISQCQLTYTQAAPEWANNPGTCDGIDDYVSPITGVKWDCWNDFAQNELAGYLTTEQQAFEEALLYNSAFAPVGNYPQVGTMDQVQEEIIDFVYSHLNQALFQRIPDGTIGSAPSSAKPITYFTAPSNAAYDQEVVQLLYPNGNAFEIEVATNVVWLPGATSGEDQIVEINFAVFCQGEQSATIHWAYRNQVSGCTYFATPNSIGFSLESDFLDLYFDAANVLHAVISDGVCYASNAISASPELCLSALASGAELLIPGGNIGQSIHVSVDLGGQPFYLHDTPISWQGSTAATHQALVAAINNYSGNPKFEAQLANPAWNPISVTLTTNSGIDPTGISFVFDGDLGISITTDWTQCGTAVTELWNGCTSSVVNYDQCPYGYFLTGSNMGQSGLTLPAQKQEFLDELESIWDWALSDIIENRTPTNNPQFCGVQAGYTYYEQSTAVLIDGAWYNAWVCVIGTESLTQTTGEFRKSIHAITMGLSCFTEDPKTGSGTVLQFHLGNKDGLSEIIYPELEMISGGSIAKPTGTWFQYLFSSFSIASSQTHAVFDLNGANVNGWVAFADVTMLANTEVNVPGSGYIDPQLDANLGLLLSGTSPCGSGCKVCMAWLEPEYIVEESFEPITCEDEMDAYEANQIGEYLDACLESTISQLKQTYLTNCLDQLEDALTITYDLNYGHYTLLYYDRAHNLIKTVSPEGVAVLGDNGPIDTNLPTNGNDGVAQTKIYRSTGAGLPVFPPHSFVTEYNYNSLKQIVLSSSPDGGTNRFWYNAVGQLILAQDAQQAIDGEYTYTRFDRLGRIVEAGEIKAFAPTYSDPGTNQIISELWNNPYFPYSSSSLTSYAGNISALDEVIHTHFTVPAAVTYNGEPQQNLRNRISYTETDDGYATYFSYDNHGNVEWLIRDLPEIGQKTIRYEYDLRSTNVNYVYYMERTTEQLIHRYEYDEENRLTEVYTSTDGLNWDRDAGYQYYVHGPKSRIEVGEDRLQGSDLTYTIEGFPKAMNQVELYSDGTYDPGMDGAYVGQIRIGSGTSGNTLNAIDIDGIGLLTTSIGWADYPNDVSFATEVVRQINTAYAASPSTYPYKASNEDGQSNTVTLYAPSLNGPGTVTLTQTGSAVGVVHDMALSGYLPDEFAFELGFYDGDFSRQSTFIGGQQNGTSNTNHYLYTSNLLAASDVSSTANSLYNGNVAYSLNNLRSGQTAASGSPIDAQGLAARIYRYDRLNRLKSSDYRSYNAGNYITAAQEAAGPGTGIGDYRYDEAFSYDHNGNLTNLQRYGNDIQVGGIGNSDPIDLLMDDLTYNYYSLSGDPSNRLNHVDEAKDIYANDLGQQAIDNYRYDAQGKLIADAGANLTVRWNVYGKVEAVENYASQELIEFEYDALGMRTMKHVEDILTGTLKSTTYYVYGAQNAIAAIYEKTYDGTNTTMTLIEQPIYAETRIGQHRPNLVLETQPGEVAIMNVAPALLGLSGTVGQSTRKVGNKAYEVTDQLRNVRAIHTDLRQATANTTGQGPVTAYNLAVKGWSDYYAHGWQMPGRQVLEQNYRFGFQGMEQDNEWYGNGAMYSTEFRQYDPRLGRWLSLDPNMAKYPSMSPYAAFNNNPVFFIDPNGLDGIVPESWYASDGWLNASIAGFVDGFYEGITGFWAAADFAWDFATDAEFREETINGIEQMMENPEQLVEFLIETYGTKAKNIMEWNEQGQYDLGFIIGEFLSGQVIGGGIAVMGLKFTKWLRKRNLKSKVDTKNNIECDCPPGSGKCFVAGTKVATVAGLIAIELLVVGDSVYAYNEATGMATVSVIEETKVRTTDHLRLLIFDNDTIWTTDEHPFFVDGNWVAAGNLNLGDTVAALSSHNPVVLASVRVDTVTKVYNLQIRTYRTYFVSDELLLVHNDYGDFDQAREEAFKNSGLDDPDKVEFSKYDPETGTVVEFKGEGGAKVGYDGPHESPGPYHDTQHISWQTAGKRSNGGAQRGNIPYEGPQHPSRPAKK